MPEDCEFRNGRLCEAGDEDPVNSQWDEDDYGDYLYEQAKQRRLDAELEFIHAHDIINRSER